MTESLEERFKNWYDSVRYDYYNTNSEYNGSVIETLCEFVKELIEIINLKGGENEE